MNFLPGNLASMRSSHPELSQGLTLKPPGVDSCIRIQETPSGFPTLIYHGAYLHSRYSPKSEAENLVRSEVPQNATAAILFGFGLGYAAEEFLRRFPSVPLLVVEPDPELFLAALSSRDLRAVVGSPTLHFLLASAPEEISSLIEKLPMENPQFIRLRPEVERNKGYFFAAEEIVRSFILRRDININTLGRFGRLWVRNLASNMGAFASSPGVALFEGVFDGVPALLLAGGPSIDEVVPHLRELSERFLVVSVETPLLRILSEGVVPDFVVMVDPQYWASRYLDWTDGYRGFIVAEPSAHPRTFRNPSRRYVLAGSLFPLGAHLESRAGEKGKLGAGGSVSTSAWDLCRLLGAVTIFTAGLDLGFPGSATHCRGVFTEESWSAQSNKVSPSEGRAFQYLREIGVFPMPSNSGTPTLTDRRMLLYKWWFENQVVLHPGRATSSLSPRAVAIKGIGLAGIEEAMAFPRIRGAIEEKMDTARSIADGWRKDHSSRFSRALKGALEDLVRGIRELKRTARLGLSLTVELAGTISRRADMGGVLERLDRVDKKILELSSRHVAGFLIQSLIHSITGAGPARLSRAEVLSRSESMYKGIIESAAYHEEILGRAANHLAAR